jgi:murein DD-endopeptidase MepM/ murein hydrolase activator NlpD
VTLNVPGGDVALRRLVAAMPNVVAVAEPGSNVPDGVQTRVDVGTGKARVGRAVEEATARGSWWVVLPRSVGSPEYLLSACVRSVGKHADDENPGVAMLVMDESRADKSYERVLAVVDPMGPDSSGLLAWAAIGLAVTVGAELDVLVLGVPEAAPMTSREARLSYLPTGRNGDLLRLGLARADELGLAPTWIAGGSDLTKHESIARQLSSGRYDVVVDDLGGLRVRKRFGKRRDIKRLLVEDGAGATPLWLLKEAPCDVLIVVDGISLGMIPAGLARTGAVAALSLGLLGAAAPAMASPGAAAAPAISASADTSAQAAQDAGTDQGATAQKDATTEKKADKKAATKTEKTEKKTEKKNTKKSGEAGADIDKTVAEATAWVDDLGGKVSVEERDVAVDAAAEVDKAKAASGQALNQAKADLDQAQKDRAKAESSLAKAEEVAEPTVADLADARQAMADADAAVLEAQAVLDAAAADASGLTGILPGGATADDVSMDEQALMDAEAEAAAAHAEAAAAYEDYQAFAADVEEAEASLIAAADSEADAAAAVKEARAAHKQDVELAEQISHLAADVDAAFKSQGFTAPATGEVTSPFGMRTHPVTGVYKLHTGTDFAGTDGNYYAAADGVVSYAAYDSAYGNMVKIDHGMIEGHQVETWYAHQPGLSVSVGQQVSAGDDIGDIGSTGYSTGPHAHVELRVDGQPMDITPYLAH